MIVSASNNDYRNPVIAEAMKVLGYVNRFNRGIGMVQEQLESNKNGLAVFDFKDITTFKVTVMSADPKPDNGIESGIESGIDEVGSEAISEAENGGRSAGIEQRAENNVGDKSNKCRRKING